MSEPEDITDAEEIKDPVEMTRVMLNALQSHDLFVRALGVNQLGETAKAHPDIAIPKLIEALSMHKDFWTVRFGAAESLGLSQNPKVIQPLIPFLKDEDPDFRAKIAETLFVLADPASEGHLSAEQMKNAIDPLIENLQDENADARANAVRALGYLEAKKAIDILNTSVTDPSPEVKKEIADALGRIKSEKSVDPLTSILSDSTLKVRQSSAVALGKIKSNKAILPLIQIGLKDEDRIPRDEAASALMKIGVDNVLKEIKKYTSEEKDQTQLISETIVFIDDLNLKDEYAKMKDKLLPPYANSLATSISSIDVVRSFVDNAFRNLADITTLEELKQTRQSVRSHNMTLNDISFKKYFDFNWIRAELFEQINSAQSKLRASRQAIVELQNALEDREIRIKTGTLDIPKPEEPEVEELPEG